jgi:CheY-like chemotaxis protein
MKKIPGYYSTYELAKLTKHAPRTIRIWVDRGEFGPGVYRFAGSKARRIPIEAAIAFARKHKLPCLDQMISQTMITVLCIGIDGQNERSLIGRFAPNIVKVQTFDSVFEAGLVFNEQDPPDIVIVDFHLGGSTSIDICNKVRSYSQARVVGLVGDDISLGDGRLNTIFTRLYYSDNDPEHTFIPYIAEVVKELVSWNSSNSAKNEESNTKNTASTTT